jgi:transmembrane sensor
MPGSPAGPSPKEALRETAAEWVIRMRGPDAERARPAFEAWLAEHPDHKRMYDRVAVSWEQSRLVAHTPAGQAWEGLPPRARPARRTWAYAVAAGIAALVMVGLLLAQRAPVAGPGAPAQEIASQVGIRQVRLGDGTVVTLDAETRLALRFSAGERRIVLEAGRARFAVAHDTSRRFIVAAGGREVVATGTVFDVSLARGEVAVALLEGGVDVRDVTSGARPVVRLAPGQGLQIAGGRTPPVPRPVTAAERQWPSGMLEFDGTPLREVLAIANRYSRRPIELGDASLGELRVTGGYRLGDPARLARTLAAALNLAVEEETGGRLVLVRRHDPISGPSR